MNTLPNIIAVLIIVSAISILGYAIGPAFFVILLAAFLFTWAVVRITDFLT